MAEITDPKPNPSIYQTVTVKVQAERPYVSHFVYMPFCETPLTPESITPKTKPAIKNINKSIT